MGGGSGEEEKGGTRLSWSTGFSLNSNHLGMVNSWVSLGPQALKEWELGQCCYLLCLAQLQSPIVSQTMS